jgi:hypothetical protein
LNAIDLLASGYAWKCLECNQMEYEHAVPASGTVHCERCGARFTVRRVEHRIEPGVLEVQRSTGDGRDQWNFPPGSA